MKCSFWAGRGSQGFHRTSWQCCLGSFRSRWCWHLWIYEVHIMAATRLLKFIRLQHQSIGGGRGANLFYSKDDLFNKTSLLKCSLGWCSGFEYAVDILTAHLICCPLWYTTPSQKHRCVVALHLKLVLLAFVSTIGHNETHLSGGSSIPAHVLMLHILQLALTPGDPSVLAV